LVITSSEHMGDVVNCLGSGDELGCALSYKVQERPLGIAHALGLAEGFAREEPVAVLLADNVFEYAIRSYAAAFEAQIKEGLGARVLLKEVGDPVRYGVAALDEQQIVEIEEKPPKPRSSYAVVGLYFYDAQLFDVIRSVPLSPRGEYEITAVNNVYADRKQLRYSLCHGRWTDAGTFESYAEANRLLMETGNQLLRVPER
jgi:glucose-1-phosphate thymidylyltransferase